MDIYLMLKFNEEEEDDDDSLLLLVLENFLSTLFFPFILTNR